MDLVELYRQEAIQAHRQADEMSLLVCILLNRLGGEVTLTDAEIVETPRDFTVHRNEHTLETVVGVRS